MIDEVVVFVHYIIINIFLCIYMEKFIWLSYCLGVLRMTHTPFRRGNHPQYKYEYCNKISFTNNTNSDHIRIALLVGFFHKIIIFMSDKQTKKLIIKNQ